MHLLLHHPHMQSVGKNLHHHRHRQQQDIQLEWLLLELSMNQKK
jgi:hypothetical protein